MTGERIERFRREDLTFDVLDSGPIDGTPVVLLHGFPQRASSWGQVASRLHEAGMRTFAPDQRGYSPGARPRSRFAYGTRELADDVAALIDAIGQPGDVHLVGHDWGAAVAWVTAARHPDRIASLTAVSVGHPRALLRAMLTGDQARRSYYMAVFQMPLAPERMLGRRGGWGERLLRGWGMDEPMRHQFEREVVGDGALSGGLNWYRSMLLLRPSDLAKVRVPTTFVWSDGDLPLGPTMARLTGRYVDAPYELVELASVKHFVPDERPDDLAEAIIRRVKSVQRESA